MTPVRTMYLLLGVGLVIIFASSFLPSIATILADSVSAIAVQVSYYYGLAGLVCAWSYRHSFRESPATFLHYAVVPAASAAALIALGLYAISTFNVMTKIVGIGGLAAGLVFYRHGGYGSAARALRHSLTATGDDP